MSGAEPEFRCTYRLQLEPGRGFAYVQSLVPYLTQLGVSHLYLSPIFEARTGSTHGYDVVDPTHVSDALGGEDALRSLAESGLGLLIDVVPNHMASNEEQNPFWRDPLWRAKFFDLDWRTGQHRRFFDVSELAGVRVEDPEVFETVHRKVLELVRDGVVDGLRIDHVDGLANPARYLEQLRESGAERVWVEKILETGETLPPWPVEGTTGYDFMADVTAVFVDEAAEATWTDLYAAATGETRSFEELALEAKLEQARNTFVEEVERLGSLLSDDVFGADLTSAVANIAPYRTYVDPATGFVSDADRAVIEAADIDPRLKAILGLELRGHDAFVTRFQQTTPAVTAKGVEDTAMYRYARLLALNEVGSDPGRFGMSVAAFHEASERRFRDHPLGMLATTTHDTKRTADVRARLVALVGAPERWQALQLEAHATAGELDDPVAAYLVLQTLVGAWPIGMERVDRYLEKALREAKRGTSWLDPNLDWEDDVKSWTLELVESPTFRAQLEGLLSHTGGAAERVSLGMTLLKLTTPGVPDIYQGDEMRFQALVDPDNRRPVRWRSYAAALKESEPGTKIDLVRRVLELRQSRPHLFAEPYLRQDAGEDVCAFTRGDDLLVAVAVRGDLSGWEPPEGGWSDVLAPSDGCRLLVRSAGS